MAASQVSDQASCAFNECSSIELRGNVDEGALTRALRKVVQRNELLRATVDRQGEQLIIHDQLDPKITKDDWSGLPAADQCRAYEDAVQAEGRTPFDLENGPLLRVRFQRRAADNYLITFTAHHLIMDGWSLWVFLRDFGHFYSAEISGTEPNLPPANQYRDYSAAMAEYHESAEGKADEEFWVNQFQDSIPVLELPTDRSRPPLKTFDASRVDHTIDVQLIGELKKIGAKNGCSLFNTMLAGFQAF